MKISIKGGLIGFVIIFIGLWIFMFITGSDQNGWKCSTLSGPEYCGFFDFIVSFVNWGFAVFFSIIGFIAGFVATNRIVKIIQDKKINASKKPLKITSVMVITLVLTIGAIGVLAFDDWTGTMIYVAIFAIFTILISWLIGKIKYQD